MGFRQTLNGRWTHIPKVNITAGDLADDNTSRVTRRAFSCDRAPVKTDNVSKSHAHLGSVLKGGTLPDLTHKTSILKI